MLERELKNLQVAALKLEPGDGYTLETGNREYAIVLISGECEISVEGGA